jgi:DNA-directed RNA polymerase subunit E'
VLFELYAVIEVEDYVRIPPSKFGRPVEDVVYEELKSKYEGALIQVEDSGRSRLGIIVAIMETNADPMGTVIPGDGATYHKTRFKALVFMPFEKEVVEGEVVSVTRAGLYVNLGVLDGFIHINQVADERVVFDTARGSLLLEETRRYVEKGDVVRARIYVVSTLPGKGLRIHMTMRQPQLGKLEWISKSRG